MKRMLAVAVLVCLTAGHDALAEPDCNCPRIQAVAANPQMSYQQTGDRFNLAILPDGGVRCWGSGCPGFPSAPKNVVAVAAGYNHALILHGDGTVEQFAGGGSPMPPVPTLAHTGVIAIAAGVVHSLALRQDGSVVAWGARDATTGRPNSNAAVDPDATNVTAIAAGYGHSLALRSDGRVVLWGASSSGFTAALPADVSSDVIAIAGGWGRSLAVKSDGRVVEWDLAGNMTAVPKGAQSDVVAVASGLWHSLALRADGTVVAWGNTLSAECGKGIGGKLCGEEPARGYPDYETLDLGDKGDGWLEGPRLSCALVPPQAGAVRSIAAGGYRSLALLNDGTVIGWGDPYGYPQVFGNGLERVEPPVPLDLVGTHCVNGLTGIRVLSQTIPSVPMGMDVLLDIAIDKPKGSQVPVGVWLADAADNGVEATFKFPSGSSFATRETKGTLDLGVIDVTQNITPGTKFVLPTGLRTLRLLAWSGDIVVETSFSIDVLPPARFVVVP